MCTAKISLYVFFFRFFSHRLLQDMSIDTWATELNCCLVAKSCLILCNPKGRSPLYSSVSGIFQAKILEWVAISSFRESSRPRDRTQVSCIGRWILWHRWLSGKRILLTMQKTLEMQVWSLGQKDPLEEEMATHSSNLAWEIPWIEDPGGLQSMELQRVGHDWATERQHRHWLSILYMGFPGNSGGSESACNVGDPGSIPGSARSTGEGIGYPLQYSWTSLIAQLVKNLPAVWEIWVQSLGWEDSLEKGKATHSSILAWRIPWTV